MDELKIVLVLAGRSIRGRYRSLIIWGVALGALGALYVALYPVMSDFLQQYLNGASDEMRQFFGGSSGTISIGQWMEIEFLNVLVPVALPFMVIVLGARTIAGSEERKTLDLLLSNPLARRQVVGGALLTMGVSLAAVLALTWIITYIAVPFAGVELSGVSLAAALAALWPLCMLFGALSLLVSSLVRRNVVAVIVPAVILVFTYVVNSLAEASESLRSLRYVSILYYLGHPVQGDFPWTAVLGTLVAVCAVSALAAWSFERRDVYT